MEFREEKDGLGILNIPKDAYYGIHTLRSLQNFKISREKWNPKLLNAIVQLKKACATANHELKHLSDEKLKYIHQACSDILSGKHHDQLNLDIYQAGSGTSTNMNVNEVISNRAIEISGGIKGDKSIDPHDDVNKGQSTNNVIPSAIRVASILLIQDLIEQLTHLRNTLKEKAEEFKSILKSGRTHLQDAVPITLGSSFNAFATTISKHIQRIKDSQKYLKELGIGGTAVGTGLNTSPKFRALILEALNNDLNYDFTVTEDGIEATQYLTDIASLSSILKLLAIDMNKMSSDLRLLSSGPITGLNEISLPSLEPGSSIMPGKINPSMLEATSMVCFKVLGNDTSISYSCSAGTLELNTHMPLIGNCIIESLEILTNISKSLADKCIAGIKANEEQCRYNFEQSMALATVLNPHIGYDKATELVKERLATKKSLKQLVLEKGYLTEQQLNEILDPEKLTKPNLD
tara:strand:- start:4704 stop:6092 length:1389 start_codon:yes stop_codon:yes gene_type:complete